MFKRVDHIEIVPSDLDRTIKFYTEVLGFRLQRRQKATAPSPSAAQETAFVELNGILIEMFSVNDPAPASKERWQVGYRRMALEVDDMDKLAENLKAKGVEVTIRPGPGGASRMGEIRDPDGLSIQLIERR